jgi:hypothetical protein
MVHLPVPCRRNSIRNPCRLRRETIALLLTICSHKILQSLHSIFRQGRDNTGMHPPVSGNSWIPARFMAQSPSVPGKIGYP